MLSAALLSGPAIILADRLNRGDSYETLNPFDVADYRDWILEVTGEDFTVVPEPVTLAVLVLGALATLGR